MPVDFLSEEQKSRYGCFTAVLTEIELAQYFHLDEGDLQFIIERRGEQNRLGVALLLTAARYLGTFPADLQAIPSDVQLYVAKQLDIKNIGVLADYAQRETTKREHTALIRQKYGYREFSWPWTFRLTRLLYTRAWVSNEAPSLLFDLATAWLIQHKILLPGASTLTRLIAELRESANNRLWCQLFKLPTEAQKKQLATLLEVSDAQRFSLFDRYRKGPTKISAAAFNEAIERYTSLSAFGIQKLNFSGIPPVRLKNLARHAGIISMHKIARMPDQKRIAILIAFVKSFEVIALDEALDVLDLFITDVVGQAKRIGQKKRLRTLKDLDRSALTLANVCALLLDEAAKPEDIQKTIFAQTPKEKLEESINLVNDLVRPYSNPFYDEIVEQYGRIARFLPRLLSDIKFKAAPSGEPVLAALKYLASVDYKRKTTLDDAPQGIISAAWRRLVVDKGQHINKRAYILCLLDRLQDALRRRDVYVPESDHWGDPRAKLLHGANWQAHRLSVCRSLGHPVQPSEAITGLTEQLDAAYKQVANNFATNHAIKLDSSGKNPSLTISSLEKLDEPPSLLQLNNSICKLMPAVDLTELLLEIQEHTGFADEFTHVSESNARADDLAVSICAVLLAEACNIGLEPLVKHQVPALTRHRLNWVKQNYLRAETLVRANAKLVDYQSTLALAKQWGGGEVASADGMRFVAPTRTVNAGANRKYFGASRGITWYNFVSDQFSEFHGIVIPGTLRDSIFVLEGLLEQQTGLKPTEIMTDTAGASDMIFGLFWLLGYQFSPRLADAGEAVFWRVDKNADYGVLNELARGVIHIEKIEQHWDDMLRIAGSLKLGTVQASELIRSLLKSERPSGLAQAIIEAGRINKTLYLLSYVDDEDYRRRILTQLNRGESRHSVARAICYGERGEIKKRYREGQEDQLGALGLVTNAVVLWNTIYMQEAVHHLEQQGGAVKAEDKARLSPLGNQHINMLGHYSFTLSEQVGHGKLRPLNREDLTTSEPET